VFFGKSAKRIAAYRVLCKKKNLASFEAKTNRFEQYFGQRMTKCQLKRENPINQAICYTTSWRELCAKSLWYKKICCTFALD
jgi:hypothetical protein